MTKTSLATWAALGWAALVLSPQCRAAYTSSCAYVLGSFVHGTSTTMMDTNEYYAGGQPFLPQHPNQPNYGPSTALVMAAQPPTVAVISASIPDDRIRVVLSPEGISGTLTVKLLGGTNHTVYKGRCSGGIHVIRL